MNRRTTQQQTGILLETDDERQLSCVGEYSPGHLHSTAQVQVSKSRPFQPIENRPSGQCEREELWGRQGRTLSIRQYVLFAAACLCSYPAIAQAQNQSSYNKTAPNRPPWPLQVEMRVPFEPTAFPSGPHVYLMYELHLTNFMPNAHPRIARTHRGARRRFG